MKFAKLGTRLIAFTRVQVKIGGRGKVQRIKIFTSEEPIARIPPEEFQEMVMGGDIQTLDLPPALYEKAEVLSDSIGEERTPQQALSDLQDVIQDHPTTLSADAEEARS